MKLSLKKRFALGAAAVATVGAVATLAAGVTFGLFSSSQAGSANTFATGTVAVGSPTSTVCTVSNIVPGDSSAGYSSAFSGQTNAKLATCSFSVTYSGSVPAYIGLGTAQSGTLASALKWEISDGTNPYATGGVINANTTANPLYAATNAGVSATYTFNVDYALPSTVTSQTLTPASLTLTVYAVQQGNNGSGVCTVGAECLGTGITSWS